MEPPPQPPRQAVPKDGYGPRGWPDSYHTARVLESTARYERFVKKLRTLEEEQKRGAINTMKDLKDKQYNDFFIRCDRRSLINNVARRVDLCLTSYEEDLKAKRARLTAMLTAEEERNIRMFVEQAQAGTEAVWQEKKARLAYLLAKRKKEHEDKYRDVPISKCVHAHPCIVKMGEEEARDIRLYQIKENLAKKMSEIELDKMWHAVALKESEALSARMEMDAIERLRREHECLKHSDEQIARKKEQRRKEQELLKAEAKKLKELYEADKMKGDADAYAEQQKRLQASEELKASLQEQQKQQERQQAETKLINDTWDSLSGMGLMDEKEKEELRRKKERDLDKCNKRIMKLKQDRARAMEADDVLFKAEAKKIQQGLDAVRCKELLRAKKMNDEARAGIKEQIKENAITRSLGKDSDRDMVAYQEQLGRQLEQLVQHRELTEAQARKLYQKQLLDQIAYNKLIKDRQQAEDLDQRKKCLQATEDYQNEIKKIMSRPSFSEEVHPFMRKMRSGLTMQEKCPCSKPDYCAVPVLGPKPNDTTNASQNPKPTENSP
ncbi:golgin subfamily A member 6-like protein 22 [Spodoptera frugiperda]|uniref:Golgin subfamily A member 6-like protein 22 n=1 Tax=Spodoptera frugiperda TaxID=7108 RepID=A0A9R0EX46_SPOFR|nr:golgin subfamily A member 6-like protein 22 [Spodoptera frugiperda]